MLYIYMVYLPIVLCRCMHYGKQGWPADDARVELRDGRSELGNMSDGEVNVGICAYMSRTYTHRYRSRRNAIGNSGKRKWLNYWRGCPILLGGLIVLVR